MASTLESGINLRLLILDFFSRPYSLIKGPTFIKSWTFFHRLRIFTNLKHKFSHFVWSDFLVMFIEGPKLMYFCYISVKLKFSERVTFFGLLRMDEL